MKQRRLIINADDFGMSRGITDGIIKAHLDGVVTSTSMMANMPASEYAASLAPGVPNLSIGVHLTLSQGRPILSADRVPSLITRDGDFFRYPDVITKLRKRELSPTEIEAEFRAQIHWLRDHGIQLSHADSHHHTHLYPCAIVAYRRALLKEGISHSRAPRHRCYPSSTLLGGPHGGNALRRIAVSAYMEYAQRVELRGLTLPGSCITAHPKFQHDWVRVGEGWTRTLANLPMGDFELGCHPGICETELRDIDEISGRREIELRILTSRQLKDTIAHRGITLIRYRDLDVN